MRAILLNIKYHNKSRLLLAPNINKLSNIIRASVPQALYATKVIRFAKKSTAIKELATDNKGNHPHKITEICIKNDCEKIKCTGLCDTLQKIKTDGYFTHKPIPGKYTRYVSDKDADNKEDTQYYCKNNDKSKEIDAQKAVNYIKNNEIKPDTKMTPYINQPEINAKLE